MKKKKNIYDFHVKVPLANTHGQKFKGENGNILTF